MMTAQILDGKVVAAKIKEQLKERIRILYEKNIEPHLAFILIGENESSKIYIRNKTKSANELGIKSTNLNLSADITEKELLEKISSLNNDDTVHGIIVQQPLPDHIDGSRIIEAVSVNKDVDGFHPFNVGLIAVGTPLFYPCTPLGIIEILRHYGISPSGKNVVILGRSAIVGKPLALILMRKEKFMNATLTVCHTGTENIEYYTRNADIVVCAMGKTKFLKKEMIKENSVLIDVGINRVDGKITGDIDFEDVIEKCSAITPVPGGVGPMTVAMLMANTVKAAELKV